jgi:periplasmic protein TonB
MSVLSQSWFEDQDPRDIVRWSVAATVVLGIHAAAISCYLLWHVPEEDIGDDASVVTVELAPIDSTPDAVERDVAPAPETMIESKALPEPQQVQKPTEEVKVERPPDETPSIIPEPVVKPPEKVEQARPPAPFTAQRVKGGARNIIAPSWQSSLVRQLQRNKRYPSAAQSRNEEGVVLLSFSLDRTGHVLARHIARSSGFADLDEEVMAMLLRAEPLPAFPASMPQARLDLTVPIRFSLR